MSNGLTTLVPTMDGSNFEDWESLIEAYLNSQGQGGALTQTRPEADHADRKDWDAANLKAMGNIRLRVTPSIADKIRQFSTAKEMWDHLKTEYSTPGLPVIFSHFKAALSVTIPANSHPSPAINDFISRFDKLRLGGGATFARRSRALGATSLIGGGAEHQKKSLSHCSTM